MNTKEKYNKFLATYSGKDLLKNHSLSDYGLWHVLGEDPNADLCGHHHQPDLGVFEGYLQDIIYTAVHLDRFWSWGSGGDIRKINVTKIEPLLFRE